MSYPLEKYKYFIHGNEVVAVSTYCRQRVRGVAKCSPDDEFDLAAGKALAAARCNKKICDRRLKRATAKYEEAQRQYELAKKYMRRMEEYMDDARYDVLAADRAIKTITKVL